MGEHIEGESRIESGMTKKGRKPPRWVEPFLGALERSGQVRAAAEMAGIDFTTAYARRKAHPDFADAWDAALRRHPGRVPAEEVPPAPLGSLPVPASAEHSPHPPTAAQWTPPSPARGRGVDGGVGSPVMPAPQPSPAGGRGSRNGRWTASAERRFFAALADQANVRRAAEAAGFSTQAVYARRLKRPAFRKQWDAAVETGKARLQMLLMDAAEKSFDPELLEVAEDAPQVSVSEALNILKAREGKERQLAGAGGRGWIGCDPAAEGEEEPETVMERLLDKLERLGERDRRDAEAKGWTWCEEHRKMVPPGWGRAADMAIADGGPRGPARLHCPHCGGGIAVTLPQRAAVDP